MKIEIPDNATNGEIIQALFPNIDKGFSNVIDIKLWWNAKYKNEIHCTCTDTEIAKSFIEDVRAVKDLLPQTEREN